MIGTYKPKHAVQRANYLAWPITLVLIGLFLMQHSFFVVRDLMPDQVEPFVIQNENAQATMGPTTKSSIVKEEDAKDISSSIFYRPYPFKNEYIGTISLHSLDLTWPIYQGTSPLQLDKGVGHYKKSVLPGQSDNAVLAGHRETVFNKLGNLELGQIITVSTSAGIFDYKIRQFRIVPRSDKTVIVPTETPVLTLITCYPFNYVGVTNRSFIVVADLVAVRSHY